MYDGNGILKALTPSSPSTCCFFAFFMSDIMGLRSKIKKICMNV